MLIKHLILQVNKGLFIYYLLFWDKMQLSQHLMLTFKNIVSLPPWQWRGISRVGWTLKVLWLKSLELISNVSPDWLSRKHCDRFGPTVQRCNTRVWPLDGSIITDMQESVRCNHPKKKYSLINKYISECMEVVWWFKISAPQESYFLIYFTRKYSLLRFKISFTSEILAAQKVSHKSNRQK